MSRRWGHRRLGRGVGGKLLEGQCLGRLAIVFCGVSVPTEVNRIKMIERTRLITTTAFSALAAGLRCAFGRLQQ